jgi:uncharacterized membrane protein
MTSFVNSLYPPKWQVVVIVVAILSIYVFSTIFGKIFNIFVFLGLCIGGYILVASLISTKDKDKDDGNVR